MLKKVHSFTSLNNYINTHTGISYHLSIFRGCNIEVFFFIMAHKLHCTPQGVITTLNRPEGSLTQIHTHTHNLVYLTILLLTACKYKYIHRHAHTHSMDNESVQHVSATLMRTVSSQRHTHTLAHIHDGVQSEKDWGGSLP